MYTLIFLIIFLKDFYDLELDNKGFDSAKMDQLLNITNMFFTRIDKKLDIVIDYIKRNPNPNIQSTSALDSTFLSYFPMNDVELLINDDNITKLVKIFTVIYNSFFININLVSE